MGSWAWLLFASSGTALALGCEAIIGADFSVQPRNSPDATAEVSSFEPVVGGMPSGETLTAIWGADEKNVFVVGMNGVRYHYRDGQWERFQTQIGRDFYAIWGTSATDVYAVGTVRSDRHGFVMHYDGDSWVDQYIADTSIYGVWGTGSLVYAVGGYGMIYGRDPVSGTWAPRLSKKLPANPHVPQTDDSPVLWSIAGHSDTNFAIAADADRVFHYVGHGDFINLDPSSDRTIVFRTTWATPGSQTDIFFGTNYFGLTWLSPLATSQIDASPSAGDMIHVFRDVSEPGNESRFIRGIWGDLSRTAFVGDEGHIYVYSRLANEVKRLPSPTTASLTGVWASGPDDVWIIGQRELILHGSIPR